MAEDEAPLPVEGQVEGEPPEPEQGQETEPEQIPVEQTEAPPAEIVEEVVPPEETGVPDEAIPEGPDDVTEVPAVELPAVELPLVEVKLEESKSERPTKGAKKGKDAKEGKKAPGKAKGKAKRVSIAPGALRGSEDVAAEEIKEPPRRKSRRHSKAPELHEEEEGEDEIPPLDVDDGILQVGLEEGEDGQGPEGEEGTPRRRTRRSSAKRRLTKFAVETAEGEDDVGQGDQIPEDSQILLREDKPVKGKLGKKKKGKKGKKVKEEKKSPKEDDVEDEEKRKSLLSGERSSISSMNTRSSTAPHKKRKTTGFRSSLTTVRKSTVSFATTNGSSSSSSEIVQPRTRSKIVPARSRISKKTSRPSGQESERDASVIDEEEVVQKIIVPSASSVASEPKKKAPKKGKGKGKGKDDKKKKGRKGKEKVVKTEAQLEEEAKAKAEEERLKALEDKRNAIAKEKRELLEGSMRGEQLDITVAAKEECALALEEVTQAEQANEEWRQYLVCDGLPAPWDVPGMNTYLHLWEQEVYTVTAERCQERTVEASDLLSKLEDILDDPFDRSERKISDWAWVAARFRAFQAMNLEYCTYRLLRDIKSKLNRIDIPTADFRMYEPLFSLCLWVSITLPTPTTNPRSIAKPKISLAWPELSVSIVFPTSLKREMVAIRGIYTKYDHLTDTCESYRVGELPPYCTKTLAEACHQELLCKMRYKYDHRVIQKKDLVEQVQEDGSVVMVEPDPDPEIPSDEIPPHVPYQKLEVSASDHCLNLIGDELGDTLIQLAQGDIPPMVVNLRKYAVIGGVYYLDLFHQPPQPQGMVSYEVFISTLTEPFALQTAPYMVKYEPPPPHEPGTRRTPEEIEEELLQQEKELDELIFVQITLPNHVYWLEPPMIVQWDNNFEAWTTHTVFDFKNIEEKGYVTFRTGVFRPVAIATLRWSNLPYQAWEIRPERDGTVALQLSCAILTLEFHVQKNTVCVRDIQSAPNEAFQPHLNVYYRFSKLRKIMRSIGIDVFPFFDTFLYVEGTCEKYWPMEDHLYFCMAYLSVAYNMTWSRWNATLDYRAVVFQMRVYRFDRPKQPNFDTVLVRAQHTVYIDCTEVSAEFTDAPAEGMRFFADLWHLVRSTTTMSLRKRIAATDKTMVTTLYRLYKNVRFLSFS